MPQKNMTLARAFSWSMATRLPGPIPSFHKRAVTWLLCSCSARNEMLSSVKMRAAFSGNRSADWAIRSGKSILVAHNVHFGILRDAGNFPVSVPVDKFHDVAWRAEVLRGEVVVFDTDVECVRDPEDEVQHACRIQMAFLGKIAVQTNGSRVNS